MITRWNCFSSYCDCGNIQTKATPSIIHTNKQLIKAQSPQCIINDILQTCTSAVFYFASSGKQSVKDCTTLPQSCSSAQALKPPFTFPCRKVNDRYGSRQRDLFHCTWSVFAMVLALASTLSPWGTNMSVVLWPREWQSDKQCRPNPGHVWGCVWYASPR